MRIGVFSPTLNKTGGGELVTLNIINALKARNHEVIVYSAEKINKQHIQNFLGSPINFDTEVTFGPNFFDPYALENIYPNLLKSFLFHFKCDLLIDTFSNAVFPWADAVYFHGAPRIAKLPQGIKGRFFTPYQSFLTNAIKNGKADKKILMTCSKHTAEKIETLIGITPNVLYPPVSDFFKTGTGVSSKKDIIVTVTRIAQDKQPETIPKIAKLVPDNFSFLIVGSCRTQSEFEVLKKLQDCIATLGVGKKVRLLLNVSREKQRELLQKAKIYLHPLVPYEAFGISVVEAMSAGCIPIAPDIGGLKEIVPKRLRYTSINEAALLVQESINTWSPSQAGSSIKISEEFNQTNFRTNFLRLMRL